MVGSDGRWRVNEYLIKSIPSAPQAEDKYFLTLLTLERFVCTLA